ncbi:MAG: hypothetical protein EA395_01605 [Phormidium sp. GEM2.Bin31]|nr:hypothetical protein [Phormidium sp. BM_Day4_Bin.17]TVR15190.1 MAG: hypothetical protein EA395_01605 [Phormidium sp. GEM2.Bin31]UCJ12800.1 MAG: hypothetical protein JWS08_03035 [Phormidium sp. PBR-2020]
MISANPSHDTSTWTTLGDSPEVMAVVGVNLSLALLGFLGAFYLMQLRRRLAQLSDWLLITERQSRHLLPLVQRWLAQRQQSTEQTRDRLQQIKQQRQLLEQSLGVMLWLLRRQGRVRRRN